MSNQMSTGDVIAAQEIGSLRIHEERAMNMVKNFVIFDGDIRVVIRKCMCLI